MKPVSNGSCHPVSVCVSNAFSITLPHGLIMVSDEKQYSAREECQDRDGTRNEVAGNRR